MKKYIMTGLVMLLPLALTFWIVFTLVDWLTGPFLDMTQKILSTFGLASAPVLFFSAEQVLRYGSKIFVLVFLFLFISLIGMVGRYFLFRYALRAGDKLLHKIPVISSVYKTSQDLIQTVLTSDSKAFKQVVLVPFPSADCLTVGLVTKEGPAGSNLVPVFIPTTPNPTSGYLILFDKSKVVFVSMSVEEAFRYVVSCGVLVSEKAFLPSAEEVSS